MPTTVEVLEQHGPQVMRTIWNLVSSPEDAQDLFQETFLQHHQTLARGGTILDARAWLCGTARHAAFRLLRRRKRMGPLLPQEFLAEHPAPQEHSDQGLLLERIRSLAAALPERQGQVFAMRHFEQLSFAEIARQLGISQDAARSSAYKALNRLRTLMNEPVAETVEDSHE